MTRKPPSSKTEYPRRLDRFAGLLERKQLDAFLVYDRHHTFYLTGQRFSLSYLFVTPRESVLFVDGRYIEAARASVSHCDVRLMKQQRRDFQAWYRRFQPTSIGFEGNTPWTVLMNWRGMLDQVEWIEAGELLADMRQVKSAFERDRIERSARMTDRIFEHAIGSLRPGMTEWEVRNSIRAEADRLGAEGLSFDCVVASGPMTSRPHARPSNRSLGAGELLLIDLGVIYQGYCSDMTRVVALGRKPGRRLCRAYDVVLAAQQAALEAVKPRIGCAQLDAIARERIKANRLGRYFTHGLGHGVGLDIHEPPVLNARSRQVLRPGMVITIEPGVYIPGLGGVRIEDLVLVTSKGHRILSKSPKHLRVVPWCE